MTSLGLRRATINRHIRGRLLLSAILFAAYTLAASALYWLPLPDDIRQARCRRSIRCWSPSPSSTSSSRVTINPWRIDRIPERFPNIVQDTLVIALFALVATLILRDRVMATTAVGAVVIGLALQDTLGNLFAGLAIQIEKPFRVGDWVTIGGQDGMVSEITWRATKMRTKAGNFVVVPNSMLAKDTIINYCEPTRSLRLQVEVGASYEVPPNVVKAVIREALQSAPELSHERSARSAARRLRRLVDRVSRSILGQRFRGRRAREGSRAVAHLLRVQAQQHHDPVPDSGGDVGRRRRRRTGAQCCRADALASAPLFASLSPEERTRAAGGREASAVRRAARRLFGRASPAGRCSSSFAARRP